ncbi:FAD-binding oxidoreductase [Rhizobium calliandrae]|uniref:FAD-binding oxidoreductase n=1 Tax=Rhizobium calliandrae TaxID=1312182 RepID=A0ABT7KPJ2_9HYPH|nr:FAD-binding oxidoreductase [Rhizobium calliandrae]MDL2410536.1 FAD-binding oxidoreductase [Rhizobium calliandrae]
MKSTNAKADDLARTLGDKLILRGGEGYDAARTSRIFHDRHPDRFPAAIIRVSSEQDIVDGVRYANAQGIKVGILAGGHSFPVWGVRDDALLLDLGGFKEMMLDVDTGIVSVTPAVQGGNELYAYLRPYGRFFAGGGCPSVGVGGFILQGGMGWNFRGWGYAAEGLVAIDVVTADGELIRADETQNADMLWAARGSGPGFFGAVTRFYIQTRPIPKALRYTRQVYPIDCFSKVFVWLGEKQTAISDKVHLLAFSVIPATPVPGHNGGFVLDVLGLAFCDTVEEATAVLAPLNECPYLGEALLLQDCFPTSMEEQYAFIDSIHPSGFRYRVDSAWVDGSYSDIADASHALVFDRPVDEPGHTFFQFALPRSGPDMAMSLRTKVMVGAYIIYPHAEDDQRYRDWSLSAMKALEPLTYGQYWGDSDQQHREVRCLTDDAWSRLKVIRQQRDPEGVFVGYLAKEKGFDNLNEWESQG